MKDSEIVRRAAELVFDETETASCIALWVAENGTWRVADERLSDEYGSLFKPNDAAPSLMWLSGAINILDRRNWRILALLFFAEILESEGR